MEVRPPLALLLVYLSNQRTDHFSSSCQILKPRAAFVSSHEVLLHLRTLKPELDDIEKAHQEKYDRLRLIREDPTKKDVLVETEHEKKFINREQLFGLKSVVDTVRRPALPSLCIFLQ